MYAFLNLESGRNLAINSIGVNWMKHEVPNYPADEKQFSAPEGSGAFVSSSIKFAETA